MNVNFLNFKKKMILSTELDVSVSGINVNSGPKTAVLENGNYIDVDLSEIKDDRVNFLYEGNSFYINKVISGSSSEDQLEFRYDGQEVIDLEDKDGNELITYPNPVNADSSLPPAQLLVKNYQPFSNDFTVKNIPIKPAHEFIKNAPDRDRSIFTDRIWLAACGFWSNYQYDFRKLSVIVIEGQFWILIIKLFHIEIQDLLDGFPIRISIIE